jgi:ech hydrogenase subunit F
MRLVTFVNTELHNLFSKPATRNYPAQPREYPQRTRGHIENDMDLCIFCGLCSKKCPTGAITVDRAAKTWAISPFSCIQCGFCTEGCPKKCLSMRQTYTQPGDEKKTNSFVQEAKPDAPAPAAPVAKAAPAAPAAPAKATPVAQDVPAAPAKVESAPEKKDNA